MIVTIEDLLATYIDELHVVTNKLIEFFLCFSVRGGVPEYELIHKYDVYWDCSGELVDTNNVIDENSNITLREISDLYTGCRVATYTSGMGFSYETIADDCERAVGEFLTSFTEQFLTYCHKHNLFDDFFTDINDEDDLLYVASDLALDVLELDSRIFPSEVLACDIGKQSVCDVYSKYKSYFDTYDKDRYAYTVKEDAVNIKYKKIADSFIIPKRFCRKICNTIGDREIRSELESLFSQRDLAILFGNYRLIGSNSYAGQYEVKYRKILNDEIGDHPIIYDYFPYTGMNNIMRIIVGNSILNGLLVDHDDKI